MYKYRKTSSDDVAFSLLCRFFFSPYVLEELRVANYIFIITYNCSTCPANGRVLAEAWLVCKFHLPGPYYTYACGIFKGITHSNIVARPNTAHKTLSPECGAPTYTRNHSTIHVYMIFVPTYIHVCIRIYEYIVIANVVRCLWPLWRFSRVVVLSGYNNNNNNIIKSSVIIFAHTWACVCACILVWRFNHSVTFSNHISISLSLASWLLRVMKIPPPSWSDETNEK